MIPAPPELYKCPICRKNKPLLSIISGNLLGGELWSDGFEQHPMWPQPSIVQKCLHCGRYSLLSHWEETERFGQEDSVTTEISSYAEAKKAYLELQSSPLNNNDAYQLALFFVHAYNSQFKRRDIAAAFLHSKRDPRENTCNYPPSPIPDADDLKLYNEASQTIIYSPAFTTDKQILLAEMYREREEWNEAYETLQRISSSSKKPIVEALLYHISQKHAHLFPLKIDRYKLDFSLPEDLPYLFNRQKDLDTFMTSMNIEQREDIFIDTLGGVYDKRSGSFLKLLSNKSQRYDIRKETRHIGYCAFCGNENLVRVQFPIEITTIGNKAFYGCKNLQDILFQTLKIAVIEDCAFMGCQSLTAIPPIDSVVYLGQSVFAGMSKLQSITLPKGIETIPESTFFECKSLENVLIPSSVRSIGSYSFQHTAITEFEMPDSVETLGDAVFTHCDNLKRIKLSSKLTFIPKSTFEGCTKLQEIDIPARVSLISKKAFEGTTSLKTVRFHGKVEPISTTAFLNSGVQKIIVPHWAKNHYKCLFPNVTVVTKLY